MEGTVRRLAGSAGYRSHEVLFVREPSNPCLTTFGAIRYDRLRIALRGRFENFQREIEI
jgi:hypothetical protein